jgi:hypothetical protein
MGRSSAWICSMHWATCGWAARNRRDVMASHPSSLGMIAIGAVLNRSLTDESLSRKIHNRSALAILILTIAKTFLQIAELATDMEHNKFCAES